MVRSVTKSIRNAANAVAFDHLEDRRMLAAYALDFETDGLGAPIPAGTIVTEQYAALGVHISTEVPAEYASEAALHPAMIFDTANPTGDDADLGTPNEGQGGPGEGWGGTPTGPGPNLVSLDNVLIVAEGTDMDLTGGPNDWLRGGSLILNFDTPVSIESLDVLDIDTSEGYDIDGSDHPRAISTVEAYDADGNIITVIPLAGLGDNSFQHITVGKEGVSKLVVAFRGGDGYASGAIDNIKFTVPDTTPELAGLGDYVWCDADKDGRQDANEQGVEGIEVKLFQPGLDGIAGTSDDVDTGLTTYTDEDGYYEFVDLEPGKYFVKFAKPNGYEFTTANVGNDALDSDAVNGMSHVTDLAAGEFDATIDAGLVKKQTCQPKPNCGYEWWKKFCHQSKHKNNCHDRGDRDDKCHDDRGRGGRECKNDRGGHSGGHNSGGHGCR